MIKNAIIINGTCYLVKRMLYIGIGQNPCDKCDIRKKCDSMITMYPCDLFHKGNKLAYFKKLKVQL